MRQIDADALRNKAYQAMLEVADTPMPNDYASKLAVKMGEMFQKLIDEAPTIDAEPVRRGLWIYEPNGHDWGLSAWSCSACKAINNNIGALKGQNPFIFQGAKYCPQCGAKMEGVEE